MVLVVHFWGDGLYEHQSVLRVQVSFTVNSETLLCSGGYDIASMTGAHNCRNSMTGNSFTVDSETIFDTVVCVYVLRKR